MSAWSEIKDIYRKTNKPQDFLFNQWFCRPPAAVMVYVLKNTSITPNQVTFLSLATALAAYAMMLLWRSHLGLALSVIPLWFAFVLDCTDGQLARMRGTSSQVGAHLDFLMDEIKAVMLVACVSGRLAWQHHDQGFETKAIFWLVVGLVGVVAVASGISITTFMRRPEYVALSAQLGESSKPSLLVRMVRAAEWGGRILINYHCWFWIPAVLGYAEWCLLPYVAIHLLYLGRASLAILWKLGRSK